jgi:putative redox protein
MKKTARVDWLGEGFKLEGSTDNGKKVTMDTGEGAVAASPAQLLLQALAGCTMMDVVLILVKSRKKPDKFWIELEAEETEKHPKVFPKIHLTYNFKGAALDDASVERAIKLSEENYCRIHAMLKCSSELTSSYIIHKEG